MGLDYVQECSLSKPITDEEWKDVMALAEKHGVMGVAFDGVQKLPKQMLPPMDMLMDWLGQMEYCNHSIS